MFLVESGSTPTFRMQPSQLWNRRIRRIIVIGLTLKLHILRVRLVQRMELQRNDAENGIAEKENWSGEWELTLLFGMTEISVENCNT